MLLLLIDHIVAFSFVLRCDVCFEVAINNQLLSIGGARASVLVNSPHRGVVNASIERHRARVDLVGYVANTHGTHGGMCEGQLWVGRYSPHHYSSGDRWSACHGLPCEIHHGFTASAVFAQSNTNLHARRRSGGAVRR